MDNKICVYAICKNELKFADQWLRSMSEADCIVVLDTGSTDGTYEKLKMDPRVTRVEQKEIKPWRFDVARNESMKLVPDEANILVCTDFDEVFEEGWGQALREAWTEGTNRVHYQYAWSHNDIGEPTDVFMYDKIHTRDYHWKFPVHEVLWPNEEGWVENCVTVMDHIYLHHFQDTSKPRGNYFDLLKLSVKEFPDDSHARMLLAREYLIKDDYDNAMKEYKKVLTMPITDTPGYKLVKLETLGRLADLSAVKQDFASAVDYCNKFLQIDPTYREPYIILGQIYNNLGIYTLGEAVMNAMFEYTTQKFTWVERADSWISSGNDIKAVSSFHLGKIDEALENGKIAYQHHPNDMRIARNLIEFYKKKYD